MSRRKQGRPQQRKNTESLSGTYTILFTSKDGIQRKMKLSVEQEKDLLVCGDCQTNFPLHDIVKFIRHKIQHCNKENLDCLDSGEDEDDDDEDPGSIPVSGCISSKQPSISAPISRKESLDSRHSPRPALDAGLPPHGEGGEEEGVTVKSECDSPSTTRIKEEGGRLPLRPKSLVDAESNTTLSEPSKFVCETCKCTFTSAWSLLQHAQKEHGMKIYTTAPGGSGSESGGERRERGGSGTNSDGHATPSPRPSADLHRTPPSAGTGSAPASPFPPHASFPFRLPPDGRRPPISPFSGAPELPFPMELDPFRSMRSLSTLHSPGLETHNHYHERSRLESSMDYYSKRLQQLASTSVGGSPLRKGEQFSSRSTPTGTLLASAAASVSPGLVHSPESPSKSGLPGKVKSCEFCGKSFRFQSNLIVHRRSHTGEKPYRCSLCPHACTQQSKLKRHMKTHYNKSPVPGMSNPSTGSEGSGNSPRSTPDSSRHPGKMEDMDDEDDEEEEDEDEEEEMMDEDIEGLEEEEGLNEEELRALKEERKTALKEDEGTSSQEEERMEGEEEEEHEGRKERTGVKRKSSPSRCESPEPGEKPPPTASSLLSEVMQNSGLTGIQPYNEAFKQALAENMFRRAHHHDHLHGDPGRSPDRSRSSPSSNAHNGSSRCSSRDGGRQSASDIHRDSNSMSSSQKMSPGLSPSPLLSKAIKREPSESLTPHLNNSVEAAATGLYPRFWFPPLHHLRDIYAANLHPSFGLLPRDPNHNGLSVTGSDSALHYKSVPASLSAASAVSKPGPSGPLPSSNGVGSIPRKDRRNDTCEFCGKVFKNCSNLTVHRRSHTGEKPYKCELCSYACAQSSKLTRHMKTHGRIGKDVYRCKFCAMPFSVASTLEKHMRKCVENRQARLLHGHEPDSSDNSTTASNL